MTLPTALQECVEPLPVMACKQSVCSDDKPVESVLWQMLVAANKVQVIHGAPEADGAA